MRCWPVALLGMVAGAAQAQSAAPRDGLTIGGTTRLRYETIDGQPRAGFNASDDLLNLRTTLAASYRNGPVRLVAELWDSRVYLADRGTPVTANEVNAVELVQAFVEAKPSDRVTVQAGRFLLNLGSRRLLAADDYRNTTNGYTGLRVEVVPASGWQVTGIYTLPQVRRPDDLDALLDNGVRVDRESFALVLWGGVASRTLPGGMTAQLSYFHLGERDEPERPTRDRSLNTAGLRLYRDPAAGRFDLDVEGFIQRGRAATGLSASSARAPVRAWFVHAETGHSFAGRWRPRIAIEYDHASGDEPGGRNGRFDTLFGMRRAEIAPAGLYNAVGRANLLSPGVRVEVAPDKRTDAFVGYKALGLAERRDAFSTTGVRDGSGASGRFAGHQLDARIRHRPAGWLQLEADAVLLAKGPFLRDAPNAPPGRWTRYLSLNATASF